MQENAHVTPPERRRGVKRCLRGEHNSTRVEWSLCVLGGTLAARALVVRIVCSRHSTPSLAGDRGTG